MKPIQRLLVLCLAPWLLLLAAAEPVKEIDDGYVLRPNDVVSLQVYNEDDLATQARILRSGEVSFPLIGNVRIGGMTFKQATETIRELYDRDYLVEPKITLSVVEHAPEFVDMLGGVGTPGPVRLPESGELDIASALGMAGGLTKEADPDSITLVKRDGGVQRYSQRGLSGRKLLLGAGDRVIVGLSAFVGRTFTVIGEVGRAGPYPFPLDGELTLVGAIAAAGGFTDVANTRKIVITRGGKEIPVDYRSQSQDANTIRLQPDDIVTVPERLW